MVVVVENEGDRIQLVPLAAEAGAALLLALPDGSAEGLHGAGGCAFVSGRWCGSPVPLLAVADGHNHRVLLIDVTSKHGVGVVRRSFHGGGGGARGRYRRFRVPTDVVRGSNLARGVLAPRYRWRWGGRVAEYRAPRALAVLPRTAVPV